MPVTRIGLADTVTKQDAEADPHEAVIVASPTAMAVTLPDASTVATGGLLQLQVIVVSAPFSAVTVAINIEVS